MENVYNICINFFLLFFRCQFGHMYGPTDKQDLSFLSGESTFEDENVLLKLKKETSKSTNLF